MWLFRKRRTRLCKELRHASSCCLRRKDIHMTMFFRLQMNTQFFFMDIDIYFYHDCLLCNNNNKSVVNLSAV